MSLRESSRAIAPRLVALLAIIVLLTLDGPGVGTAEARDLSGTISAVRRGQVSAEASMRQADRQLKSLTRHRRAVRKRVEVVSQRLERLKERRAVAHDRADSTAGRLALARLHLQRELEALAEASDTRVDSALASTAQAAVVSIGAVGEAAVARYPDGPAAPRTLASLTPTTDGRSDPAAVTGAALRDVRRLESELRQTRKAVRQLGRKTRHAQRARGGLLRSLSRIGGQRAVTVRRREGAEAVLGQAIRSMSKLAHKRVAKKTKSRTPSFAWPIRGRISQGYHRGHDGIDIVAARGAPIRAMAIGVVAYVGWNPWDRGRRAFVVVIAHPDGYETVYGHLLPIRRVTVGHVVKKGQVIGHMGNTGHSTGVHLHIEVRRGFRTLNPLSVL